MYNDFRHDEYRVAASQPTGTPGFNALQAWKTRVDEKYPVTFYGSEHAEYEIQSMCSRMKSFDVKFLAEHPDVRDAINGFRYEDIQDELGEALDHFDMSPVTKIKRQGKLKNAGHDTTNRPQIAVTQSKGVFSQGATPKELSKVRKDKGWKREAISRPHQGQGVHANIGGLRAPEQAVSTKSDKRGVSKTRTKITAKGKDSA